MVMPHKYNYFYFSREKIPGVKKSKRKYHWAADSEYCDDGGIWQ